MSEAPDGPATEAPARADASLSLLDAYERMLLLRRVEETIAELRERGEVVGSVHLGCGQEAIPVGVLSQRSGQDPVFSTYRGHCWALGCGVPPESLLGEVAGGSIGAS